MNIPLYMYLPIAGNSVNMAAILGLGGAVGLLSGIFGVGGGFFMTPLLIMLGIPPTVAAASDSNQIIGASTSGTLAHFRLGNVDFKMGFLLLAGISPKFAALLTTIPQCVLGGATVTVFSTIAMTGMKLIASQDLTARNTTIVGLSAALGVGISQASEALSQFPEAFTMVFGQSPVVIATIMAVLLNLILPREK